MHPQTADAQFRAASFAELNADTLYELLRLRVDVFVVEQQCAYPELDGRDTEPGTRHLWLARDGVPVAYLRILDDGDAQRIGRVAAAKDERGAGHARRLMREALAVVGDRPCVLHAQAHLTDFYAGFGFTPSGLRYVEDGIPHVPMRRDPGNGGRV